MKRTASRERTVKRTAKRKDRSGILEMRRPRWRPSRLSRQRSGLDIRRQQQCCLLSPQNLMTVSSYMLPPPIYLPSSGGYTSSRFTEDVGAYDIVRTLQPRTHPPFRSHSIGAFFRSASTVSTKTEGWCAEQGARTMNRGFYSPLSCFRRFNRISVAQSHTTALRNFTTVYHHLMWVGRPPPEILCRQSGLILPHLLDFFNNSSPSLSMNPPRLNPRHWRYAPHSTSIPLLQRTSSTRSNNSFLLFATKKRRMSQRFSPTFSH